MLSKNAINLLEQRYCLPNETPKDVYKRVAKALALTDEKFENNLYKAMYDGAFLPNTPCIMNAGKSKGLLHACFCLPIGDNMKSIFETITNTAEIFKHGGGVGINFSTLRPKDSLLSNGGTTSGALSFMGIFNSITETVKQGGRRRGALMGVLNYNHPEIFDFITSKLQNQLTNFNISVMLTDKFMKQVENNESFNLEFNGTVWSKTDAKNLFDIICFSAWKSGDPGVLFLDRINQDNPLYPETIIDTVNPCQPADSLLLDDNSLQRIDKGGETWTSWYTGKKEVLELTCNNGLKLRYTPEHRIMLDTEDFIEAKNSLNKSLKWGLGNRKLDKVNEKYILLGFLFGDGYTTGNKFGVGVKLNQEKESEIYNFLLKWGFKKQNKNGELYLNRDILEKKLNLSLDFLDSKVYNRELPEQILYGNNEIVANFLKGLFEANGSINIQNQMSLKTTCKSLAEKVQILLASFGIISWLCENKAKDIEWGNGVYRSKKSYNLQIAPRNVKYFLYNIGFFSKLKNNKIIIKDQKYKGKLKVIGIKSLGEIDVWDYKMKSKPAWNFCQGIVAHNCSEVALPHFGACCLGSINLSKCVKSNKFDHKKFKQYLEVAVRTLLSMNQISWYPLLQVGKVMKELNPIGVGLMGFADTLIKLGINYDSQEALDFIDEIGKTYKEVTEKKTKSCFYKRIIAPTGSLSILADCSSGIEPVFERSFQRHLTIGVIEEVRELYQSKYCRTAMEISPEWHLKVQSKWQEKLDGGLSKTINLPNNATVEDVRNIYMQAWKTGTKGVTVFRDGCKEGVLRKISKCSDGECHL